MKKRIRLAVLLVAVMLLVQCLPANVFAAASDLDDGQDSMASRTVAEDFDWSIADGILTVTGTGDMPDWGYYNNSPWYDYRLDITEIHVGDGLTSVGAYAFKDARNVTTVVLPDTLTYIGSNGFSYCRALTEIVIPEGVTGIGEEAFSTCESLSNVSLPDGLKEIGRIAFVHCDALETIVIPDSVTTMGSSVFNNCSILKNVTLSANLTELPAETFTECGALETLELPGSITSIGFRAFYRCSALTELTIPDSVVSIGEEALYYCGGLTSVNLSANLSAIGPRAFSYCTTLSQIALPEGLETIGTAAFNNCDALTEIIVPDSVTTIDSYAFENCDSLVTVVLPPNLTKISDQLFQSATALENVEIPETVTEIGSYAFRSCSALQKIVIPDSVTVLGTGVFSNCESLSSVTLSASLTELPENTFTYCESLTSIIIPEGVTTIGLDAFSYCYALADVTLPDSLTAIGNGVFNTSGITGMILPEGLTTIGNEAFRDCDQLTELVIPDSVTAIGSWAFHRMDGITSITIPDSVTALGDNVFNACGNLVEVNLGSGITAIPNAAFQSCPMLKTLEIPANISSIGEHAFRDSGIETLTIPDTVTSISQFAFYQCKALEEIVIPDTVTSLGRGAFYNSGVKHAVLGTGITEVPYGLFEYCNTLESVTIPEGYISIGSYAFRDCKLLAEIDLPSTLTAIGDAAFTECDTLTEVVVPAGVTVLNSSAFSSCDKLESVTLPEGLTTLGSNAFFTCTSLVDVVLPQSLTTIGRAAFSRCSALTTIHLPAAVTSLDIEVFDACTALAEVTLPEGLTAIPESSFRGCRSLTSIQLPSTVTTIGQYAFQNSGLATVNLHENVTTLRRSAFEGTALTSVTISPTVTTLEDNVFASCGSLTEVVVEEGITALPNNIFNRCSALTDVTLPEGLLTVNDGAFQHCTSLKQIDFPSTLTTIGNYAFSYCSALESIRLPDSLTTLGYQAFRDCVSLHSAKLNEGLTQLQSSSFYNCDALTEIALPKTLVSIDSDVFGSCDNLEWVWIAPSVTSIHSNAFRDWRNLTIGGIQGSTAESFAAEHGIPFVHALTPGIRLKLNLTDTEGNAVTGDYTVYWYQNGSDEPIATGTTLHAEDLELGYSYQLFLGKDLGMQYVQPERMQVPADAGSVLTLVLEPIAQRTLSGRVVDDRGNALQAELTLTQYYSGGGTNQLTVRTDENGSYSLTIDNVRTEAVIRAEGYFTSQQYLVGGPTDSENITAADVTLYPLPEGNRISLTMQTQSAVREGEEPQMGSHNGAGLVFSLFNETQNTVMDAPSFQNGTLYFNGAQVREGDTLRISAIDPSGLYQTQEIQVTVDGNHTGSGQMLLVENGSVRINSILGCSQVRVMLFDANGSLLEVSGASGSYRSPILADGSYQLVLLGENDYIRSVSDIDVLTELGLTREEDYVLLTVQVRNGAVTVLSEVRVPVLNATDLCNTDPAKTSIHMSPANAPVGQYVQVRLAYALKEGVGSDAETVQITLPDGMTLYDGAMYLDSESIPYRQEGNVITVETGLPEAVLYFYVMPGKAGSHSVTAAMQYTSGSAQRREPLDSVALTVENATITVPERTKRDSYNVTGKALPGSTVKVYEGQTLLGTTTANAAGTWSIKAAPVNYFNIQVHDLYAVIEHEDLTEPIATAVATTIYDMWYVELERVKMHTGRTTLVFDYENPKPLGAYNETGSYTFELEFDGDSSQLYDVTLSVYCLSDRVVTVPVEYLEESGKWVVTLDLPSRDAPVNVGVGYGCRFGEDYGDGMGYTEAGKEAAMAYAQRISDRAQSMLTAGKITFLDDGFSIPVGIAGVEDTFSDVQVQILDYSEFTGKDFAEQGFYRLDNPETGNYAYLKLEIADDHISFITLEPEIELAMRLTTDVTFAIVEEPEASRSVLTSQVALLSYGFEWPDGWYTSGWTGAGRALIDVGEDSPLPYSIPTLIASLDAWQMEQLRKQLDDELYRRKCQIYDLLEKVCPDGTLAINGKDRENLQRAMDLLEQQHQYMIQNLDAKMDAYALRRLNNLLLDAMTLGLGRAIDMADELGLAAENMDEFLHWLSISAGLEATNLGIDLFTKGMTIYGLFDKVGNDFTQGYDKYFDLGGSELRAEIRDNYDMLFDQLDDMMPLLYAKAPEIAGGNAGGGGCNNPRPNNPPGPVPKVTPIIDPAGFIYEAVESNRIEGATVTVYYQDKKGNTVLWDAENYDQLNPLTTDENGAYAWFVPMGLWRVKCEMPGYQTVYSEWLPVPPPQMEVNLGLVSLEAPKVENIEVFETGAIVTFSQFMDITSVREALTLSTGTAEVIPLDAALAPDGVTEYATRFQVAIPEGTTESVQVLVSGDARNYAGTPIETAHSSKPMAPIAAPTEVNMRDEYVLVIGQELSVNVTLLPGLADRTLVLEIDTPQFLTTATNQITTDASGNASFHLTGLLPGEASITVREPGSGLFATAKVHIRTTEADPVAAVTATLSNGAQAGSSQTVPAGTIVTLVTETAGAEIRYTLDGSCPCRSGAFTYTEPLVLTEDTQLQAAAVVNGVFGPTAEFRFTMETSQLPKFEDVLPGAFYEIPVAWAVENGITKGTSDTTFGPNDPCMRAHVVTFLWRAAGSPEPTSTENPFTDVKADAYFYKAVLWAVEKKITNGTSTTEFSPYLECNRAQVVTFLYRAIGSPNVAESKNPFADVPAGHWFTAPVLWAVENGITNGLSADSFGPNNVCNRAQIVTFLYRTFVN